MASLSSLTSWGLVFLELLCGCLVQWTRTVPGIQIKNIQSLCGGLLSKVDLEFALQCSALPWMGLLWEAQER